MSSVRPASARPATRGDLDSIDRLRAAALDEQGGWRGGELYGMREARPLPDPDLAGARLWVGVLAHAVVGYLSGRTEDLPAGGLLGIVDGIYVDPQCRAVGVGEAMMSEALAWFVAQGCSGVDAIALPGARVTKNFFEESGFTSRLLVMHHRL